MAVVELYPLYSSELDLGEVARVAGAESSVVETITVPLDRSTYTYIHHTYIIIIIIIQESEAGWNQHGPARPGPVREQRASRDAEG